MKSWRGNPWAILLVLCMGFFMVLLDLTIVNIAIPSIIDSLKAGLDQILWVLNAYTLTYAVLLITAGRLGDRFGQRNMFAAGLAIFTAASAYCGLAQDPSHLIFARILQAIGGALLTPQTLAILTTQFPPQRRGAAFGVWGAVAGVATLAGPTLGGLLTTYLDWRWIFYVNLPIGIATIVLALLIIPDVRQGRRGGIELVGIILASLGLFLITFGLIEGQKFNWSTLTTQAGIDITIPEVLILGAVVLAAFFVWDFFRMTPLVPLSLFQDRNFSVMNWVSAVLTFGMIGLFLPLTIYLQSALGFSPIKAGLTLAPQSLISMAVAPFAGRYADKYGGKYIVMAGLALFAVGMTIIDFLAGPTSDWYNFLPGVLVAGFGLGMTFAPLSTVALRNIRPRMAGAASGVLNTVRQLGGAVGSAVVGAVLQNRLATAFHDQAVQRSGQLPPAARQPFIDGFSKAASGGLDVGRHQSTAPIPGVPPEVAQQIAKVAHDVFAYGFIDAMRPTLVVPIVMLAVASISCLAIKRRVRPATAPAGRSEASQELSPAEPVTAG
ncbi:MAG: DHA2 family efflux MFS transporter permease subunit [Candidatus Dormibacter sp.]|uniref:DHA2 family efflux MFS transporter permease subunit n=1 Tax=Candidatus Dormibacter sp. TaxID=2973982 RepID=UPI0026CB3B6D